MNKDKIYKQKINAKFSFDENVASVFDDMIARSVPFYNENVELIKKILKAQKSCQKIIDMGCSTGNLLINLAKDKSFNNKMLIGFDNATAMLEIAKLKAKAYGLKIDFRYADIFDCDFSSDVVILNYTLQFIRPMQRASIIERIFSALNKNGILILGEKISSKNAFLDKVLIDIYHDFKAQNGYSNTEIAHKREALENILIPYTLEENISLLKNAGFGSVEVVFVWANFATMLAFK